MKSLLGALGRLTSGVVSAAVRRPIPFHLSWAAVLVGAIFLLGRFRIDPDVAALLPPHDPTFRLTRELQRDAAPARVLMAVFRADRAEELEKALPPAVEQLRKSGLIARVVATREEFGASRREWVGRAPAWYLPPAVLEAVGRRMTGPERRAQLESIRRRLAEDPVGGKQLVLRDPLNLRWILDAAQDDAARRFPAPLRPGTPYMIFDRPTVAFIRVVGTEDSTNVDYAAALQADVRERLKGLSVPWELAGAYVSSTFHATRMKEELRGQTIVSGVLVVLFLLWFTRSLVVPHLLIVPVALSIVCTLALGGWILGPLTPLAISVTAIMIAQGIDYPIHVFSRYREERRSAPPVEAMVRALNSLGTPFLGAMMTTVAAFLMLLGSGFPGFRQMGALLALGIGSAVAVTATGFSGLLVLTDGWWKTKPAGVPWLIQGACALHRGRLRRPVAGLLLAVGVAAWGAVAVGRLRVDLNLRHVMTPGDPGTAAVDRLEGELGVSTTPVLALVPMDRPVDEVRRGVESIQHDGTVAVGDGIHELLPSAETRARVARFRGEMLGWTEATMQEMASLGLKPEPFRKSLQEMDELFTRPPPDLAGLEDPVHAALKASMICREGSTPFWVLYLVPRRALWEPEARALFDERVQSALGPDVRFYGAFHLMDHYSGLLVGDLKKVGGWTFVAIVVLTILSVGRVRAGLVTLIPVLLATGVTLAFCSLRGGAINLFNIVAIPMILGIGVDHGIYFTCRMREPDRPEPEQAIRDVGAGIFGSTLTTLLGFGSLATSGIPGLSSMGVLVLIGVGSAFAATLVILPALAPALGNPRKSAA